MKKLKQMFVLASSLVFCTIAFAQESSPVSQTETAAQQLAGMDDPRFAIGPEWNLESSENGIKTYTRYLEGMSLKAFKVVTEVDAPLPQVLMFLNDSTQFHRWIFMLKEARILQNTDPEGVSYNHMITKVPWPIKNRDVVVKATIEYNKELGEVIINSVAAPDFIPEKDDLVRIRESSASWRITKLNNGKLRLELTSHAEPGGAIPKWLSNMVVLQLPKHMFSKLPEILESDEVRNIEFDSILIFGRDVDLN